MSDTPLGSGQTASAEAATAPAQYTAEQIKRTLERLRTQQSLGGALLAGLAASAVGAALWAIITDVTGYQIGFMAIGVGFLVGYGVRLAGKGVDPIYGVVGAVLALVGCLAGNLFAVVGIVASQESLAFMEVVARLDVSFAMELMTATFSPIDLVFYGIAIYQGYKLSFRKVTAADVEATRAR